MSDHDRDREPIRETERTTVVTTDGGGRGGGGILIAVVLIVALLVLLFILFGGGLNKAADEVGLNVDVDMPQAEMPDIDINVPENVNVQLPDVDVKTDAEPKKKE
jgi:hypothetical protein